MKIDKKQIEHLANLAQLSIDEQKIGEYADQLSSILEYTEMLQEVDIESIESQHSLRTLAVPELRDDVVVQCTDNVRKALLEEVPQMQKEYIQTKNVL